MQTDLTQLSTDELWDLASRLNAAVWETSLEEKEDCLFDRLQQVFAELKRRGTDAEG